MEVWKQMLGNKTKVVISAPAWDTDFGVQGNFDPLLPRPHF